MRLGHTFVRFFGDGERVEGQNSSTTPLAVAGCSGRFMHTKMTLTNQSGSTGPFLPIARVITSVDLSRGRTFYRDGDAAGTPILTV